MAYAAIFQGTANADHIDTLRESLVKLARDSRNDPGTIRYEFYQFEDKPEEFVLFGIWESEESWRNHVSGEVHKAYEASLPPDAWAVRPVKTRLRALEETV